MVIAETGTKPAAGEAPAGPGVGSRLVAAAPVLLPLVVASVGVVGTLLLLLEQFRVPLVLLLGGLLSAVLVRVVGLGQAAPLRRDRVWDALAVLVALAFAAVNARYSSQDIFVGRDPGVYTLAGQWLAHHHSVLIPSQEGVFLPAPISVGSAGFGPSGPGQLYAQGAHLLPQMLALVSAVLGESAMFRLNVLLGGLGLLAVYGFGRLVVSRGWALLAVVLLGGTLPQIAFSRDDYTEPLSQLFIFGGLALLWTCRPGQPARWATAGMVVGAGCMARIDAFLVLPSLIVFAGLVAALASRGRERRRAGTDALAALAGAGVPAVLGVLDLQQLSSGYYRDLHGQFRMIETLLVASSVAVVLMVAVAWTTPLVDRLRGSGPRWRRPLGAVAAAGVVLAGLALAVRPLLGTAHTTTSNVAVQAFIKGSQIAEGGKVDPTRTYAEQSVTWLVWYLGPLAVALGLLGTAWLVLLAVRRERLELVPFLVVMLTTSGLYLYDPSITPDQIWAMRRDVPIIMPGVVIAAVFVLGRVRKRVPAGWVPLAAAVTGAALLLPAAFVTWPLARVREGVPQLTEARRVCATLPKDAAVLVVGELALRYPQTVRSYCDLPAAALVVAPTASALAGVAHNAAAAGHRLYLVSTGDSQAVVPSREAAAQVHPVSKVVVRTWHSLLLRPPHGADAKERSMYVGRVGADGLVAWLEPASPVD